MLTPAVVAGALHFAHAHGRLITVDTQGNLDLFAGYDLVKCNHHDAATYLGRPLATEDEVQAATVEIQNRLGAPAVVITRAGDGLSLYSPAEGYQHLAATNRTDVYDATGAGDTVIAVATVALAAGASLLDACRLANLAAGIVVRKRGNRPIERAELAAALVRQHEHHDENGRAIARAGGGMGIVSDRDAVIAQRAAWRAANLTVVLTNGVFDLLHVGHLRSLQAARAMGDRLIVGINTDATVTRAKGPRRPIVPAAERAELVAGLACVDATVIFPKSTAVALVTALQPDIYVKGGDYTASGQSGGKPLPEATAVLAYGGEVRIVPLVPEISSSDLIERVIARNRD